MTSPLIIKKERKSPRKCCGNNPVSGVLLSVIISHKGAFVSLEQLQLGALPSHNFF